MTPSSAQLSEAVPDIKTAFDSLLTPRHLATLLDVQCNTLCFSLYKKQNYRDFQIPRKSGEARVISTPITPLKLIQRKLNSLLHELYGARSVVHGFVKKKNIRTNAARHLGATWVLNIDLRDFFPSIHFGRVQGLFAGKPYALPKDVAMCLAQICCHQGRLPIGAPTSLIVANMICAKMDAELKAFAWGCGCVYTRYADDITISTKRPMLDSRVAVKNPSSRRWEVGEELEALIERNGFSINRQKTRVSGKQSSMEITGIRINSGLNVSQKIYRQIRSMLHAWEKYGEQAAHNEHIAKYIDKFYLQKPPPFRSTLRGKIEFIGFVKGRDDRVYVRLLQRYQELSGAHASPIFVRQSTHESVIRQAIWLLQDKSEATQGTAFAIEGNRLFTAAHNTNDIMWASRPSFSDQKFLIEVVDRDDELDIAEIKIKSFLPVQLAVSPLKEISLQQAVCVVGFPHYHAKDSVAFRFGRTVQVRWLRLFGQVFRVFK